MRLDESHLWGSENLDRSYFFTRIKERYHEEPCSPIDDPRTQAISTQVYQSCIPIAHGLAYIYRSNNLMYNTGPRLECACRLPPLNAALHAAGKGMLHRVFGIKEENALLCNTPNL